VATLSIEMLSVGATSVALPLLVNVGVDESFPPHSDRKPSLWQGRMNELGGALIHLFDPQFRGEYTRWAYDIIEERRWKEFRFRPDIWPEVRDFMSKLVDQSPSKTLVFFSDAQWSNEPSEMQISFEEFNDLQENCEIRMNTAYILTAPNSGDATHRIPGTRYQLANVPTIPGTPNSGDTNSGDTNSGDTIRGHNSGDTILNRR
jgi:hypothetical protein